MPRRARRLSDTKVYHVMLRGNERRNIFLDDEDRERFIDTLRYKQEEKTFSYFAYCLMSNHVHLIVDEGEEVISKIMQRINGSYAYYFNKKYQRSGHLFQDRFKSEVIEKDRYLLAAIRYVHNNPIKAGMIKNIEEYRWSSYREIISNNPSKAIVDKLIKKEYLACLQMKKN